jgi:hypothetical protein
MNVHMQRTLNESYYLGLNSEQLSQRYGKHILDDFEVKSKNILLVSQLWLWKINNVVITAFPREGHRTSHLFDYTLSQFREAGISARRELTSNQLVAWILSECIHRLDPPCMADLEEPVFYFLGKNVARIFDDVQRYMDEAGMDKVHITKEKGFIDKINFIRAKLSMIKNILLKQEEVWKMCLEDSPTRVETTSNQDPVARINSITERPKRDLNNFNQRIRRIDEDAERVEKVILVQLDLKAKHAGLRESHNSTALSAAVVGFTIITIIFTPLSFLASLFALPIDLFQRHQNAKSAYTKGYIETWMGKSTAF